MAVKKDVQQGAEAGDFAAFSIDFTEISICIEVNSMEEALLSSAMPLDKSALLPVTLTLSLLITTGSVKKPRLPIIRFLKR